MRIKTDIILWSSLGIYLILYFFCYPKAYTIFDEACYLDLAYALRNHTVYLEKADLGTLHYPIESGSHLVSIYPIGNSALLVPFTFLGPKGLFLYGLLFHLLGYIIFIKVLKESEIHPKYAILYLFYPPQLLFSRTLMSDIPAAFFALLAFYMYQKERYLQTGISLGLSFLVRYPSLFLLPVLLIFAIIRSVRMSPRIHPIKIFLGFIPFLLFVLLYNRIVYGAPLHTGYPLQGPLFDPHRYIMHLLIYIFALSIFYPLMIISPFVYKKSKDSVVGNVKGLRQSRRGFADEILTSCIIILFFYILFSFAFSLYAEPSIKSWLKTSLLAIRYFLPVIPLFLIAYSFVCEKYLGKGFLPVWALLIIISIGLHRYHAQYLEQQAKFRDSLYSHTTEHSLIICNGEATELISKIWRKRSSILLEEVDFSNLPQKELWLATLIRLDKPNQKLLELKDSIIAKFNAQLVEKISSIDKKFELYELK